MLLVLNSEITASIPKNKLSRHRGCENEESSHPTRQVDLSGWRERPTLWTWLRQTAKQLQLQSRGSLEVLVGMEITAKLILRYSFILILKKITVGFLRGLRPPWCQWPRKGHHCPACQMGLRLFTSVLKIVSLVRFMGAQKTIH